MTPNCWLASFNPRTCVQSSYLSHAERGSSTKVTNKEVEYELDSGAKKRKQARDEYHHYTAELVPRSRNMPARVKKNQLSRNSLWNSAIVFWKVW